MDYMEYLLFLQNLRNGALSVLNEPILFVSAFMGGAGGIAVMALVYWCLSKWAGALMLLNLSSAYMANETLKNIFCISRPFVRDPRLVPYVPASGYSFPSGHTMMGTAIYGSAAVWQRKRTWFVSLCVLMTLLTAFGRNWIGVHTPQDVLVGMAVSCMVIAANLWIIRWIQDDPKKEVLFLVACAVWTLVLLALIPSSGKVCGIYLGVITGLVIERRWIGFQVEGSVVRRAIFYVGGMAAVLAASKGLPLLLAPLGSKAASLVENFLILLLVTAGWPAVMRLTNSRFFVK